jgi:hypothetical protein
MIMHRSLLRLAGAVVALGMVPAHADDLPGLAFSHHDWELVCDNTRSCRAAGYQVEGEGRAVSVLLTRAAGPGTPVKGEVMLGQYDEADMAALPRPGSPLLLRIDGRELGEVALNDERSGGELAEAQVAALIDVLPGSTRIEFVSGESRWRLSDRGASAVLLKFDDFQGRLDTPGALLRRGERGESAVPPPLPAPVIQAAALATGPLPELDMQQLRAELAPFFGSENCHGEGDDDTREIEVERLSATRLLASSLCWRGAYNEGYGFWLIRTEPPYAPELVTEWGSSHVAGEIHAGHRGRGLGDCWSAETWTWDGERFLRTRAATSGMCRLVAAGGAWDLPRVVSEVRPAAPH